MECSKSILILLMVLAPIVIGAPYNWEDDEYDDDPELPDRKQALKKQQAEQEALEADTDTAISTTTSSTTLRPHFFGPGNFTGKRWVHAKEVRGYHILSDGPFISTELVKTRPMLRIWVNIPDTVRDVEKSVDSEKRVLEVKIRNWDRVHKVHIKVPFGYQPEDLKVSEQRDHISIIAPIYSDINESEFRNVPQIVNV